jgi:hypothetical protein
MKPWGALLIYFFVIAVLAVVANKVIFKLNKTEKMPLYVWSWISLLIGIFAIIIFANIKGRVSISERLVDYWNSDYNFFDINLYSDAWKDSYMFRDTRFFKIDSIIYLVPILVGIASVLLLPSIKFMPNLVTPLLTVQTALLTYTLISSDTTISNFDEPLILGKKIGYTVAHGVVALVPFLLAFKLI